MRRVSVVGNSGSGKTTLGRDPARSIIAWSWQQHAKYRRQFEAEAADPANAHLTYVRLRSPAEARRWLAGQPA